MKHDISNDTFIEVEHGVAEKPNNVKIPRRPKIGSFLGEAESAVERRYAGVLLVDGAGHFVMQRRDARPGTYNPGKLSMFGGRIEGEESALQCACRELYEESGLQVEEGKLLFLVETVFVREDKSKTHCTIYLMSEHVDPAKMNLQEGRGIELVSEEAISKNEDLTELSRIAVAEFCKMRF